MEAYTHYVKRYSSMEKTDPATIVIILSYNKNNTSLHYVYVCVCMCVRACMYVCVCARMLSYTISNGCIPI